MINRRIFFAGLVLAPNARAQRVPKVIGVLFPFSSDEFETARDAFVQAMRGFGYIKDIHFALAERFADGKTDRLPELAAQLVKLKVDLIYASSPQAVAAAQGATTRIPIVFDNVSDPVQAGFADSLAHPGRNITGMSNVASDLNPKRLQFLKQMVPELTRVALLVDSTSPFTAVFVPSMRAAAESLGLRTQEFSAAKPQELEPVFQAMVRWGAGAVAISTDAHLWSERERIAQLALKNRLASLCPFAGYVEAGALISYGGDRGIEYQRVASYVRTIFRGASAGDLPIEQPTQINLVINNKTAKALQLTIPRLLLIQADKVIE